jgi:aspartyl protease family protein
MSVYRSVVGDAVGLVVVAGLVAAVAIHHETVFALLRQSPLAASLPASSEERAPRPDEISARRSVEEPRLRSGVELKADSRGHFQTSASINGRSVDVLVDTGATLVALSYEDAERAGIFVRPSDFSSRVSTANGVARVARVTLDTVEIGDIRVRNVAGVVTERGAMRGTLLGMSFLGKLSKVQIERGRLLLSE